MIHVTIQPEMEGGGGEGRGGRGEETGIRNGKGGGVLTHREG